MKDYYEILEISSDATLEQIKHQYRFLVQAWLPEKFASPISQAKAEDKLKEIDEAFGILIDPVKREQYDRQRKYSGKEEGFPRKPGFAQSGQDQAIYEAKQEAREKAARLAREKYEVEEKQKEARLEQERREQEKRQQERRTQAEAAKKSRNIRFLLIGLVIVGLGLALGIGYLMKPSAATPSGPLVVKKQQTLSPTATKIPLPTKTVLVTATPILDISAPAIREKDNMLMVYVEAGAFQMGGGNTWPNENPEHSVILDAFWIDQTEVTNGKYALCVQSKACTPPSEPSSVKYVSYYGSAQYENYPVVHISWDQARAYCTWAGGRLPTEAEWEKAARGKDGRIYPWGSDIGKTFANYDQRDGDTSAVGSYEIGKSPYGAYDMAGNVWEWVADWYDDTYYRDAPSSNPAGPSMGIKRVLRGGSWFNKDYTIRTTYRYGSDPSLSDVLNGFRCARSQ
ncbi:MAG TPA: SUMF1/EgtB/PvdO family nonheme iron enzyme [Anaerolineales bacterium]|jgi:formylglycine-generating enzyme required for sulfatase activity